jgi:ZIP family zinc transporter
MIELFSQFHPVIQALIATGFTWGVTALGASMVFLTRKVNQRFMDSMLGFAAGVMLAASYWSLLAPSIEMSESGRLPSWLPPAVGFIMGAGFLLLLDRILPHLHLEMPIKDAEGLKTKLPRSALLVLAITIHNIPEGLAVGVAFGAVAAGLPSATLAGAIALAIGIGIQNFPEGVAVSLPIRRDGYSRRTSFLMGQFSGIVEPVAGVLGAALVLVAQPILPYALAFAAGAMVYVVVEEVIPEAERNKNTDIAAIGAIIGFTIMMILDVALG